MKPIGKKVAKKALKKLAGRKNISVEEAKQIFDRICDRAIRRVQKTSTLKKHTAESLFKKWKASTLARRWVCRKNKAHKMTSEIIFDQRGHEEILMTCTECDCSYTISDVVLIAD